MFLRRLFCLGPPPPKNRRKRTSKPSTPRPSPKASKPATARASTKGKAKPKKTEPRVKDKIPAAVRNEVWVKYHQEAKVGVCYCCNKRIRRYNAGWHCSHVIADVKGGTETVDNLRTCCAHCNLSMGDQNLYVYIQAKNMQGPGRSHLNKYLKRHPSQMADTRTNNWIT